MFIRYSKSARYVNFAELYFRYVINVRMAKELYIRVHNGTFSHKRVSKGSFRRFK